MVIANYTQDWDTPRIFFRNNLEEGFKNLIEQNNFLYNETLKQRKSAQKEKPLKRSRDQSWKMKSPFGRKRELDKKK